MFIALWILVSLCVSVVYLAIIYGIISMFVKADEIPDIVGFIVVVSIIIVSLFFGFKTVSALW